MYAPRLSLVRFSVTAAAAVACLVPPGPAAGQTEPPGIPIVHLSSRDARLLATWDAAWSRKRTSTPSVPPAAPVLGLTSPVSPNSRGTTGSVTGSVRSTEST